MPLLLPSHWVRKYCAPHLTIARHFTQSALKIFSKINPTLYFLALALADRFHFRLWARDAMRWCLTTISNHMAENEKLRSIFPLRFPPLIIVIVTLMWWNRPNESWIKCQQKKKKETETVERKRINSSQAVVLKLSCVLFIFIQIETGHWARKEKLS